MEFYDWLSWVYRRDQRHPYLSGHRDWFLDSLREAWECGELVDRTVDNFRVLVVCAMGYEQRDAEPSEVLGFINGNVELLWLAFNHTKRGWNETNRIDAGRRRAVAGRC